MTNSIPNKERVGRLLNAIRTTLLGTSQKLPESRKTSIKMPPKGLTRHDLLVAKMDFGFWDNLLRECFSINGDKHALWPQCIPTIFPNLPKGHTNASIQREISSLGSYVMISHITLRSGSIRPL